MAKHTDEGTAITVENNTTSPEVDDFYIVDRTAIGGVDSSELPRHYYRSYKLLGTCFAFSLGVATAQGGFNMLASSLNQFIAPQLGGSPNFLWVATAYPLAQSIAYPVSGRLSDLFGRRYFWLCGNLLTLVGWVVGGQSHSLATSIAGSTLIGVGSVTQNTGGVIVGELFPNDFRYQACAIVTGGLFPIVGLSSGIARSICLNSNMGWRWVYHLNAIFTAVILVVLFFCYDPPTFNKLHKNSSKLDAIKHFDWIGILIFTGSALSMLIGLTWGAGLYSWSEAKVIVPTVVGISGFGIYAAWEHFGKPRHALLPLSLFSNRNWLNLTLISSIGGISYYALSLLLPQQLSALAGASLFQAGWATCSIGSGIMVGFGLTGVLNPRLLARYHIKIQYLLLTALVIFTAALGSMNMPNLTLAKAVVCGLIASIGNGWFEALAMTAAPLELEARDIGLANGAQFSIRTVCGSIASAVYVTVLTSLSTSKIRAQVPAAILKTGATPQTALELTEALASGNATAIGLIPDVSPAAIQAGTLALRNALSASYHILYYISVGLGAACILLTLGLNAGLMQSRLTSEVARKLQNAGITEDSVDSMERKNLGDATDSAAKIA